MDLLERQDDLQLLGRALDDAVAGCGRIALVSGEAGIGKTSFVERFLDTRGRGMQVLKGNCDALFTPAPLGPLYDIARQSDGPLLSQLESDTSHGTVFSTLLDRLRGSTRPVLLVIEDVHWADEATYDLIVFLSRRIAQAKVLFILTYRDDEVGPKHPLRVLLGDLAMLRTVVRIELARLTIEAVRTLIADQPIDPASLHGQTSGNPFFVTEVLAHAGRGIPKTVRDAVLARAARLSAAGRHVLEAASVIGGRIDHAVMDKILGGEAEGLAECMKLGMLEATEIGVAFRHALVRDAILSDLDSRRLRELNRMALDRLRGAGAGRGDPVLLAHCAEGAGDGDAVIEFGAAAARAAAAVGAHRVAAAQYRRVLGFAGALAPGDRAPLFEAYAEECAIVDDLAEASHALGEAAELWRQAGNRLKEGEALAALAWPLVRGGRNAAAEESSRRAIELLESLPPTRQLAAAYRIQAHLRMLDRDHQLAVRFGRKAIELATRFQDDATLAAAELVVGSAMLVTGDEEGRPHLDRSLVLARQANLDSLVGLAYLNLGSSYGEQYRFAEAERHLTEGLDYTGDCDLDHAGHYMRAWLALTRLYQGRWSEASDLATAVVELPRVAAVSRIMALAALGRVRVRRGDPGAAAALDEALDLALQTNTLQRLAPVRAARAEAAWLSGERERVMVEATAVYDLAIGHRHRWHAGEFSFWRWRAGESVAVPEWSAAPFLLQIKGDWQGAAETWEHLGCPYEQARALADGDEAARLAALEIFDRLGAGPAAAALRQLMRGEGVRCIPRGPRSSTRRNPFGLTAREMQILGCLSGGLSNGRIGTRLHISPKTVDHHVSAVLAKIGACTRGEAARIAREQNLLPQNREATAAK
jgi:ATP/maltotriose-dependent transcriptional regulator MalT